MTILSRYQVHWVLGSLSRFDRYDLEIRQKIHILDVEDVPDIRHTLPPPLVTVHVEGSVDEVLLLVLDLDHLLLDRVLGDVLVDGDILGLTQSRVENVKNDIKTNIIFKKTSRRDPATD